MKAIYTKLLAVQKAIKPILKDEPNPFYKSKYFDINSVVAALRPILDECGVIVLQPLSNIDGKPAILTIVADPESGESIELVTPLIELTDPQKIGGVITYFRRYALTSMFLLEGEEDDDANKASGVTMPKATVKPQEAPQATEDWNLEKAGATLVSLKGATKAIKDWDASARSWMAEKHANPMVKSAAKYYNEHEVPFV